ncbi:hypothetical protein VE04_10074, partial [Pseudogymnoascus sp. 24MN13]
MAGSSVRSVGNGEVKTQVIEDEIVELKRKLQDAEERLKAVTNATPGGVPPQPAVSNNVYNPPTSSHFLLLLADAASPSARSPSAP